MSELHELKIILQQLQQRLEQLTNDDGQNISNGYKKREKHPRKHRENTPPSKRHLFKIAAQNFKKTYTV